MAFTINQRLPEHNIERPSSALVRGVNIREESSAKVNPCPIVTDDQASYLLEDYLSPRKLRDLTGVEDLNEVTQLEMRVDTMDTSLGNFGTHLPNLLQLKLSDSNISSLRDLGSCLAKLRVLWMSRCGLEDLQGVGSMSNLRELYLSYNEITDVTPCGMLETLEILDLEGNCINDINQIGSLAWCPKLYSLTLEGNPICATTEINDSPTEYREAVHSLIPHLRVLDDEPLKESNDTGKQEEQPSLSDVHKGTSAFDADWQLLNELMKEGTFVGNEAVLDYTAPGRPGTGSRPQTSGYRPGTALRPYSALKKRPGTSNSCPAYSRPATMSTRPGSSSRPDTSKSADASSRKSTPSEDSPNDDASQLTSGAVICGNPYRALSRRQTGKQTSSKHARMLLAQARERALQSSSESVTIDEQLADELNKFRQDHEKKRKEINATKAPQVLVVNFDDAVSLSDDGEMSDSSSVDEQSPRLLSDFPQDLERTNDSVNQLRGNSNQSLSLHNADETNHADHNFSAQDGNTLSYVQPHPPTDIQQNNSFRTARRPNISLITSMSENISESSSSTLYSNGTEDKSSTDGAHPVIRSTSRTPDSPDLTPGSSSSSLKSKLHKTGKVPLLPSKFTTKDKPA